MAAIKRLDRTAPHDPGKAAIAYPGPLAGDERLQIHAGAEALAGAGEHPDAERVLAVELVERGGDAFGRAAS